MSEAALDLYERKGTSSRLEGALAATGAEFGVTCTRAVLRLRDSRESRRQGRPPPPETTRARGIPELYGIDVGAEPPGGPGPGLRWLGWDTHIGGEPVRQFFIPAGLVGEIYGTDRWALGS